MAEGEHKDGEVLDGRYRLKKRLGRGGFGDVWRAEELLPDGTVLREVALKLLRGSSPDWSAEARIIASLRHPALVTVYAAGLLQARRAIPFVAMELLLGKSLAELIAGDRTIRWRRVLSWAREAAAALDVIHRAGVVHLDLKPANLFLADGAIKVLDFGIARKGLVRPGSEPAPLSADPEDDMSTAAFVVHHLDGPASPPPGATTSATSRAVVGTPGFMAPEIFEDGEASPATDAYALAACVVQLATGRLPQAVTSRPPAVDPSTTVGAWFADVQAATVRGQIRDLRRDHPELPAALTALLERWLSLDPAARAVERGSLRPSLDAVWRCPHGWRKNPYRGLEPHDHTDEGKLFGRDHDVARLSRELVDQPGVVLYGEGAIGLTSLAVAGVVPGLARHFADDKHDWRTCRIALAEVDEETTVDDVVERSLRAFLDEEGVHYDDVGSVLTWAEGAEVGAVVFVDDLDRVLEAPPRATHELESLFAAVAEGAEGVRVVATVNVERVAALAERRGLGETIRPWLRFIGPLHASAVAELVRGPATATGRALHGEEVVIEELQGELAADGARLALVSLALEAWWDGPTLDAQSWRSGGGMLGRLRAHADATLEALEPSERRVADAVLLRTLTADGSSSPVAEGALLEGSDDRPRLRRVIGTLVRRRLVMRSGGQLRLSHIGLATAWPRLSDLRLHDLDRLSFLEELRTAASRWAMSGRARKLLWSSDVLGALDRLERGIVGELGDTERAFVDASRHARKLRRVLQSFAVVACLTTVALGYFVNLRIEEREAEQRQRLVQARTVAALGRMITESRRTTDPYHRVALLTGALAEGAKDPVLALELLDAGRRLPSAEFLSLGPIARPDFPWGERWLVGTTAVHLVVFDFEPPAGREWAPLHYRFQPHAGHLTDVVPLAFDSAVVTRDQRGEVRIWRLQEQGTVALAAEAPERCAFGPLVVASDAPVIACTTPRGVARWDLRHPREVERAEFDGRVLDVSPDGGWVVAARLGKLLLWNAARKRQVELNLDDAASVARVSPRDPLVAVIAGLSLDVLRLEDGERLLRRDVLVEEPVSARWAPSGVDVAVCDYGGEGEWHYLRVGGRAPDDPPPPDSPKPCRERRHRWPKVIDDAADYGSIANAEVGPRVLEGGWQRQDGSFVSHDLVRFDPNDHTLRHHLVVAPTPPEKTARSASVTAVFRDDEGTVWQLGESVVVFDAMGTPVLTRAGHLLARCPNGRLLAWRKKELRDDATQWEIFGARVDVVLATIERTPGNILGADPACRRVVLQGLDGTLSSVDLASPGEPVALTLPGGGFVFEGYVFDVWPSQARAGRAAGLWLAASGGAMLHVDGATGKVTAYGHALGRADAMADGPAAGELLFADERGVVLRRIDGADRVVLAGRTDRPWDDIALSPDGGTAWLSWAHGVAALDIAHGDVLGELEVAAHDRLTPWDDAGSLLLWPFSYKGPPRGLVVPNGPELVRAIGEAASNVRASLGEDRRAVIRLDD